LEGITERALARESTDNDYSLFEEQETEEEDIFADLWSGKLFVYLMLESLLRAGEEISPKFFLDIIINVPNYCLS
jgi:hypothetical protein